MGTLAENVARVKADFKSIKDMAHRTIGSYLDNVPTSEYAERMENGITSNYDNYYYHGMEQGRTEGYNEGVSEGYTIGKGDGLYEGVEQGRQEVISNSKYIEKTASGKVVFLNDVSEVAHEVKVYADTPTEVKVCGKNLIPYPYNPSMELSQNGITLTINDDGSIVANGTASALTQFHIYHYYFATNPISILPNIKYTLSGCSGGSSTTYEMRITDSKTTATMIHNAPTAFSYADTSQIIISILVRSGATLNNVVFRPQIELYTATSYEPYKEPQTITATLEGTEIPSMCPIMNFLTDGEITVDYYGSYGMNKEWNQFWDEFQQNGRKTDYKFAFYGANWNDAIFKPKYDMFATDLTQCFYTTKITSLSDRLKEQGVRFDTSACKNLNYAFAHSALTVLPKIDMSACTTSDSMCVGCYYLTRCEGIVSTEITKFYTSTFQNCSALEHIIFEGTIASDINLQWSKKLSRASILSLLSCLIATVTGKVVTLPSKCIDTATDTLALIQSDTELNTAYTQALANGYTITFA